MVPPSDLTPRASSRSIHSPDSLVSRPTTKRRLDAEAIDRTSAAPSRATVSWSSGYSPAVPRTPSVPKSRDMNLLFDNDVDDGWVEGRDAEVLGRINLDSKIVVARS